MGRSKGRHRAPSTASVTATRLAAVGAATLTPVAALPATAQALEPADTTATGTQPAVDWTHIIRCESGGNPKAENPNSTASGLLQFIDGSWRHYGGTKYAKRASSATPAQQIEIGNAAYARDGLGPWDASRHCWGKHERAIKSGTSTPGISPAPAPQPAPVAPAPTAQAPTAPQGAQLGARDEHGRGWYRCDDAHLRFELCDPHTRGQVFQYPAYAGHNVPPLPGGSAVAPMAQSTPLRAAAPAAAAPAPSVRGQRLVATARTWQGVKYVWGGTTRAGVDCSGLVLNVFRANGVKPPRTAHQQMKWAKRIPRDQAQPGDLAFRVNKSGRAYHVGIVIGNGRWIESPQPGQKVKESAIPAGAVFGRIPT